MMPLPADDWRALVDHFERDVLDESRDQDLAEILGGSAHLVCVPETSIPFTVPYLPRVGSAYGAEDVVVYASSQSLQSLPKRYWSWVVGGVENALWRLYVKGVFAPDQRPQFARAPSEVEASSYRAVPIQPYSDGILAGAIWVAHLALGHSVKDATEALNRSSVANFYRVSLRCGSQNMDPGLLDEGMFRGFTDLNWNRYADPELRILRPGLALVLQVPYRGAHERLRQLVPRVLPIRDPASLPRKRHAVLRERWAREAASVDVPKDVKDVVEACLEQLIAPMKIGTPELRSDGQRSLREAYRLYLISIWNQIARNGQGVPLTPSQL